MWCPNLLARSYWAALWCDSKLTGAIGTGSDHGGVIGVIPLVTDCGTFSATCSLTTLLPTTWPRSAQ